VTVTFLSRRAFGLGIGALAATPAMARLQAPARAPFAANLQSLGWWMRRTTGRTIAELMPYYQEVVGLPLIRAWEKALVLLWAGEDQVFEVKADDNPAEIASDLSHAALLPVFRVHDLPRWRARMRRFGYQPVGHRVSRFGETLFYQGPDRLMLGFEQRSPRSPLPSDRRADARWRAGPGTLPGMTPLPDTLHNLGRAIRQVADVRAMTRFYRDRLGLRFLGTESGSSLFALGRDTVLELAPGGVARPEPADRTALSDTMVLRIHDLDAQRAALPRRGVPIKGEMIVKEETTRLVFVADPEGWIVGIEERGRVNPRYIDDVEADRRWRTGMAK